jgi:hypothetical protein
VQNGSTATGQAAGQRVLTQLAGQLLTNPQVVVTRDSELASVEVTGAAMTVIPGLVLPVQTTATGTTEPGS